MEPLIAILITIVVMFIAWLALREKKHEEVKYDECTECHHLIVKGSGQIVTTKYVGLDGGEPEEKIYCELHKKPYDKVVQYYFTDTPHKYWKKIEPWKRVNEDGTDYKEPNHYPP